MSSSRTQDQAEATAFRVFFRRTLLNKKHDDDADALHSATPHLRQMQAIRFGLNDNDNASLLRIAQNYQADLLPIRKEVNEVIAAFHARFPRNRIPPGVDHTPPAQLVELQQEEDALTLRYRDILRNSMQEQAFQRLHKAVMSAFGATGN